MLEQIGQSVRKVYQNQWRPQYATAHDLMYIYYPLSRALQTKKFQIQQSKCFVCNIAKHLPVLICIK